MAIEYGVIESDLLIIGSEAGGAMAAIEADKKNMDTVVVNKGMVGKGGVTIMAVYSCCAALGLTDSRDNPEVHFRDTVIGGKFINNQKLVEIFTNEAPERVIELEKYGINWSKKNGKIEQGKMPGHTYPRALHVGWSTGPRLAATLRKTVKKCKNVRIYDNLLITNLITTKDGRVTGAIGLDVFFGKIVVFKAKATVIATGGGMYAYEKCAGTYESTGDGYAYAYRAGAELIDMEFVQFFPTGTVWPKSIEGAEGPCNPRYFLRARLYNNEGERFMMRYDPVNLELATRDILARAIAKEIKEGRGSPHGGVWQDCTFLAPNIIEAQMEKYNLGSWKWAGVNVIQYGIDPRVKAIELGPVPHYFMGGIKVNEEYFTGIPGLFAGGESAGGIDGANRLAGNALSECLVTGARAGIFASEYAKREKIPDIEKEFVEAECNRLMNIFENKDGENPVKLRRNLQAIMTEYAGLLRDEKGLLIGLNEILKIRDIPIKIGCKSRRYNREWIEGIALKNMLELSEMIIRAALLRKETRGSHCREDYPEIDNKNWLKNIIIKKKGDKMTLETNPVVITKLNPEEE